MKVVRYIILILIFTMQYNCTEKQGSISLHPENTNYFLYQSKPTILVTSAEHYGAVMNADFDYRKYLFTLKNAGLNYTRIFIGTYSEIDDKTFGIVNNNMNPRMESWLTPWAKVPVNGKFDLTEWNKVFFDRLKAFINLASENGIVVEITLFSSYYSNHQWSLSPLNTENNINHLDTILFNRVNTIHNGELMEFQKNFVRKVVRELNIFDNIFFEIQNEPWADNNDFIETIEETDTITHPDAWQRIVEIADSSSIQWQKQIATTIREEEANLPNKHLIAQNISNFRYQIENPDPNISIFNFHYAYPEAASSNLKPGKVIGLDETGFMPKINILYRSQAWKFMLAGGAIYNNLDFSFIVGFEDGTHVIEPETPGWGGIQFREQLKFMKEFVEGFNFIRMKPDNTILQINDNYNIEFQALSEPGKQYAVYLMKAGSGSTRERVSISSKIPVGNYQFEWMLPVSGESVKKENLKVNNDSIEIICPDFTEDIVLKIVKSL